MLLLSSLSFQPMSACILMSRWRKLQIFDEVHTKTFESRLKISFFTGSCSPHNSQSSNTSILIASLSSSKQLMVNIFALQWIHSTTKRADCNPRHNRNIWLFNLSLHWRVRSVIEVFCWNWSFLNSWSCHLCHLMNGLETLFSQTARGSWQTTPGFLRWTDDSSVSEVPPPPLPPSTCASRNRNQISQ